MQSDSLGSRNEHEPTEQATSCVHHEDATIPKKAQAAEDNEADVGIFSCDTVSMNHIHENEQSSLKGFCTTYKKAQQSPRSDVIARCIVLYSDVIAREEEQWSQKEEKNACNDEMEDNGEYISSCPSLNRWCPCTLLPVFSLFLNRRCGH